MDRDELIKALADLDSDERNEVVCAAQELARSYYYLGNDANVTENAPAPSDNLYF